MTNWTSLDPNQLLPSGFVSTVGSMTSLLDDALAALSALQIPPLSSVPSANPVAAVVNSLLDAVKSLLEAGRVHVLAIPITKKFPSPPRPTLPPTLADLQAELDTVLGPSSTANAAAYANSILKSGGNAGFLNSFSSSLFDTADNNRPQYGARDAVAMGVLMVGAPSFAQVLAAAQTLDYLVQPQAGASMTSRIVPVPQGLSAKVVGASVSPGTGVGVRLDWTPPVPGTIGSPYFPGVTFSVSRYAVIRSTDPKILAAKSVSDLFSTSPIKQGLTEGANTVIAVGSGGNSAYLDTDAKLDKTTVFYYAVAWEVVANESGTKTTLTFDKLSNVAKTVPSSPSPQMTGTEPNWQASGTAINAIPPLGRAVERLIAEAQVLLKSTPSPADQLGSALQLAQGATKRVAARATELADDVNRLAAQLSRPLPAMYSTVMTSPSGGNAFLIAELSNRLFDTTDSSRPPFDNGEYVCGVCLVAGAPGLADLAAIIAFLEALLGGGNTTTNPLLGVLGAIDTLVTQAETTVFGPGMTPFPSGTDTSGIDPITGRPVVQTFPVISDSGQGVAGADPANPNAGFTNKTDPSKLC